MTIRAVCTMVVATLNQETFNVSHNTRQTTIYTNGRHTISDLTSVESAAMQPVHQPFPNIGSSVPILSVPPLCYLLHNARFKSFGLLIESFYLRFPDCPDGADISHMPYEVRLLAYFVEKQSVEQEESGLNESSEGSRRAWNHIGNAAAYDARSTREPATSKALLQYILRQSLIPPTTTPRFLPVSFSPSAEWVVTELVAGISCGTKDALCLLHVELLVPIPFRSNERAPSSPLAFSYLSFTAGTSLASINNKGRMSEETWKWRTMHSKISTSGRRRRKFRLVILSFLEAISLFHHHKALPSFSTSAH
ncbi:hypothetical protein BDP27DRAFT_1362724 [Rhodocollybia butyracea]|uniref:Uncharacterized protein n=1 Tax=Rhodocollybia butyracea TaxID=206335 RepID=A0A9P5PVP4_9AGAR|nr:hypothetical protein BDP27DRAFT_1362724 [Rhodocollybia butyracea]